MRGGEEDAARPGLSFIAATDVLGSSGVELAMMEMDMKGPWAGAADD